VMEAPDGGDGEGVGTTMSSLALCSDPQRQGTALTLTYDAPGVHEVSAPETCWSLLTPHYGDVLLLGVTFAATLHRGAAGIQLAHCLGPEPRTYPRSLQVGVDIPSPDCTAYSGVVEQQVTGPREIAVSSGTWNIDSLGFDVDSRVTGNVDVESRTTLGDEAFLLQGTVDLPVMRDVDWR